MSSTPTYIYYRRILARRNNSARPIGHGGKFLNYERNLTTPAEKTVELSSGKHIQECVKEHTHIGEQSRYINAAGNCDMRLDHFLDHYTSHHDESLSKSHKINGAFTNNMSYDVQENTPTYFSYDLNDSNAFEHQRHSVGFSSSNACANENANDTFGIGHWADKQLSKITSESFRQSLTSTPHEILSPRPKILEALEMFDSQFFDICENVTQVSIKDEHQDGIQQRL